MRYAFLSALLILSFPSFSQVAYSKSDLAAIRKNRAQEKAAYKNWDRQLHYEVGAFYDKIYQKYRDTSMMAAIRNYIRSTETEGDLMDAGSLLAAYRLGEIYETGLKTDTNYYKAMFYYLLSHDKGASKLAALKNKACTEPRVLFSSPDSVVISFSPFCISDAGNFVSLKPMAEKVQGDFGKHINISMQYPRVDIKNSYYSYFNSYEAPGRIRNMIAAFLDPYLSADRLNVIIGSEPYDGDVHILTFKVVPGS